MNKNTAEQLTKQLVNLLKNFNINDENDLREQVLDLIPAFKTLRKLGTSLIPQNIASSARDRILHYLKKYPKIIIHKDELAIIAGIDEWARRVRELRVQLGWNILSGKAAKELQDDDFAAIDDLPDLSMMKVHSYILVSEAQDREAAHRWHVANDIRKQPGGAQSKIIKYLLANVGALVSGEELRYVANDKSEWARRTRELRTEEGWQINTRTNGRPDLSTGIYILESDRQLPVHDRKIPDPVRRAVLMRDMHICQDCGWNHDLWNPSDPRHLELHHLQHHIDGGENTEENLLVLCKVCHDVRHSS